MTRSKLLSALDREKGRNYRLENQRKQEKKALKRKKQLSREKFSGDAVKQAESDDEWEDAREDVDDETQDGLADFNDTLNGRANDGTSNTENQDEEQDGSDEDIGAEESDQDDDDDDDEGGIPLSDIESEELAVASTQRLTINNTAALLAAYKSIAIPKTVSFSTNQTVTSSTQTEISDVNDDLNRELAFYKQALEAAVSARELLRREGVPFTRPKDYFAETVKSDSTMQKIKAKMVEEATSKKVAAEARKQRELKKFGKAVQVAKLQERDKAKRETLEKINQLKRKRKDAGVDNVNEEDMFDVALEKELGKPDKRQRSGQDGKVNVKRQRKDAKFGHGGKKKFSKSGDAISTGDLRGFSAKKMKGQKKGTPRPGKSKRAKKL